MNWKRIVIVCLIINVTQFVAVIYLPSFPYIVTSLKTSPSAVISSLTIFYFCFGLAQLLAGTVSDHWGRRPLIFGGFVVYIIAALVSALTETMWLFLLARIFDGLGAGAMTSTARATINDTHKGMPLIKGIAFSTAAASVTSMSAPLIGGVLQAILGWRANFVFLAVWGGIVGIFAWYTMPETLVRQQSEHSILHRMWENYRKLLSHRIYMGYALTCGITFSIMVIYFTGSPFLLQDVLGLTPIEFGLSFLLTSGGTIFGSIVLTRVTWHPRTIITVGLCVILASILVFLSLYWSGIFTVWSVIVPVTGLTIGVGWVYPRAMGHAVRQLREIAGSAAAVAGAIQMFCCAAVSLVVAHLPKTSPVPMGIFMLATLVVVSIVFYLMVEMTPRPKIEL